MTDVSIEVALPEEFVGKASAYLHLVVQRAMSLGSWPHPFSVDTIHLPDKTPVAVGLRWDIEDDPADVHRVPNSMSSTPSSTAS
jgi:hypothetical protein